MAATGAPESFIGKPALDLPSPSLVLSRPIMERNASEMLADVSSVKGLSFRPHVKTLKVGNHRYSPLVPTVCVGRPVTYGLKEFVAG